MVNIEQHLGLVHKEVSKIYKHCREIQEYEDVLQAGYLGLCKAANNFDESRGLKFSTYAVPCIRGEILSVTFRDKSKFKRTREGYERVVTHSLNKVVTYESERPIEVIDSLKDDELHFEEMEVRDLLESSKLTEKQKKVYSYALLPRD